MIFTKIGTVVAVLLILLGVFAIASGFIVAENPELSGRYFSSNTGSGERIDQGFYTVGLGIAAGVITEISRSLAKLVARGDAT